jgi:hypothetical protein
LTILLRPFGFLALLPKTIKEPEEDRQKRLSHLCLREERKKTKGPEKDSHNRLRPPMSEDGEQENQRA